MNFTLDIDYLHRYISPDFAKNYFLIQRNNDLLSLSNLKRILFTQRLVTIWNLDQLYMQYWSRQFFLLSQISV